MWRVTFSNTTTASSTTNPVEIVRAIGNSSTLVVEYVETAPSRGTITAQVLTAPYHLVAIPKHDGTVMFKKVDK